MMRCLLTTLALAVNVAAHADFLVTDATYR